MARVVEFKITNGPSKFDLMTSLFVGGSMTTCRSEVSFHIHKATMKGLTPPSETLVVFINELGREDGSGESWNFKGELRSRYNPLLSIFESNAVGYFSTQTRRGWVKLQQKD